MRQCHSTQRELFADLSTALQLLQAFHFWLPLSAEAASCISSRQAALKARHDIRGVAPDNNSPRSCSRSESDSPRLVSAPAASRVRSDPVSARQSHVRNAGFNSPSKTTTTTTTTTTTESATSTAPPVKGRLRNALFSVRQRTEGVIRRAQSARQHQNRGSSVVAGTMLAAGEATTTRPSAIPTPTATNSVESNSSSSSCAGVPSRRPPRVAAPKSATAIGTNSGSSKGAANGVNRCSNKNSSHSSHGK